MFELVPQELVPRDSRGDPILGGIFTVAHKPETDRLINDRRPPQFVRGVAPLGILTSWVAALPVDLKGSRGS